MEYRVLGTLEVLRDGQPIDLGAYRQRALVALLLTGPNRVFSTDQIIDALWGEDGAADRQSSLWTYVSALRKALEPEREKRTDGTILLTRTPGYLLAADPADTDVGRFEQLVGEGRSLMEADPDAASLVLGEALALWRGHAFEDFTYETFAQAEIARLEELRLEAVEARIDADLRRGLAKELVSELESLVRQQPMREGFTGQLMLALARSGRQADALRTFQQLRSRLGEELGIEPSGRLQRIEEQIVTGAESATASPAPPPSGDGRSGLAVRGYELREELGQRTGGSVYRAYQPSVGREVAIKVIEAELANDPDFIRAFEAEAQVVARLEHPHIVPLYDYWREPDAAYLVMRLMGGGTLADVIETSALTPAQTVGLVDQLGSALQTAHHANVLHRDIRSTNVLLDDDGNAYLSDFAIAGDDTIASPGTDVHGLGLVVAQALTGMRGDIDQIRGALEPAVREVVDRATAPEPEARHESVAAFVRSLHQALGASEVAPLTSATEIENPYKGLRAFAGADAAEFFGRERLVERLIARLGEPGTRGRFVAVVGPSGSGKSSVVRAGLLPALRQGALAQSASWFTVELTPAPHPFEQLDGALRRIAVDPPAGLLEQLTATPDGLHRALTRVLPDDESQLVLVVDQFEELFTQVEPEVADRFAATLVDAIEAEHSRVRVVITLRADFYDRPLRHRGLGELLRDNTEVITPMTPEELERAITGPVATMGVGFEPALVAQLITDIVDRTGALPLLQYTLTELFDARKGMRITEDSYRALGGVSGALASRAEGILGQLGDDAQDATRQVFLRLVTLGEGSNDTRRRVLRSELEDLPVDRKVLASVLDTFGRHRMLSFDRDPVTRGPTVEISHEAMLTEWDRLRTWIDGARHDVRNQRRLSEAMREWRSAGEAEEYLLRGGRLDQLHGWATTTTLPLSLSERAFLEASIAERDRADEAERDREQRTAAAERRARARARQLALAGVLGVVIAALAVFGIVQWRAADDERAEAEAAGAEAQRAQEAAERAQADAEAARADTDRQVRAAELRLASVSLLEDDPELALMLATAAVRETASLGYATEDAVDAVHWALQALSISYELDEGTLAALRSGPRGLTGVWMIAPAKLVEQAEQAVDRPLTAEECAAYFEGACPQRRALPPDLPLRFGDGNYGILPRVQGFYGSLAESVEFSPLAGTRLTLAAPFLGGDVGLATQLERFTLLTGIEVDVVASSVFDIVRVTAGSLDRPDLVAVPGRIPDWAQPLALDLGFLGDDELTEDYGNELLDPVSDPPGPDGDRAIRGLPMSLGLDTVVYYPKAAFAEAGYSVPTTWSELIELSRQMVADGHAPWCFGYAVGPTDIDPFTRSQQGEGFASGFRGSQLIKTLAAGTAGADVFAAWQAGDVPFSDPRIVEAGHLADELVHGPGFVRGGSGSISSEPTGAELERMFEGSDNTDPGCWFAPADDGMLRAVPSDVVLGVDLDFFFVPPLETGEPAPMVVEPRYVAGLVDRPEVRAFLDFVGRRSWGEFWAEATSGSAFIPAHRDFRVDFVGLEGDPDDPTIALRRRMMTAVQDALETGTARIDRDRDMPLAIGGWTEELQPGAFWQGVLDWVDGRKTVEEVFADIDAAWAALRATDDG